MPPRLTKKHGNIFKSVDQSSFRRSGGRIVWKKEIGLSHQENKLGGLKLPGLTLFAT
jgi:hypothetical protein